MRSVLAVLLVACAEQPRARVELPSVTASSTPAQPPPASPWIALRGDIGGVPAVMHLHDGTKLRGMYHYVRIAKAIALAGTADALVESVAGKTTGTFSGTLGRAGYSGTWTSPSGKTVPFSLSRVSPGTRPVRDGAGRGITPDEAQARLERVQDDGRFVELVREGTSEKTTPKTCLELEDAHARGLEPGPPYGLTTPIDMRRLEECAALALLRDGIGAQASYVSDLALDAKFPASAPADLDAVLVGDGEWLASLKAASARGDRWSAFDKSVRFSGVRGEWAGFDVPPDWWVGLEIVGYGDFDLDGFEDVAIDVTSTNRPNGHMDDSALFVLTRTTSGGPLRPLRLPGSLFIRDRD